MFLEFHRVLIKKYFVIDIINVSAHFRLDPTSPKNRRNNETF